MGLHVQPHCEAPLHPRGRRLAACYPAPGSSMRPRSPHVCCGRVLGRPRLRQEYNDHARAVVQMPMTVVGAGPSPGEARALLDRAIKAYDKERSRKHKSSSSLQKRVVHLQHQHHVLQLAAIDYVDAMEQLNERRRLEFVVQLGSLYEAQRAMFTALGNMMEATLPDHSQTVAAVTQRRAVQDKAAQELRSLRRTVDADAETMKATLARLVDEEKAAKKKGGALGDARVCSEEVDAFLREVYAM